MAKVSILKSTVPDAKRALDYIGFEPRECDLVVIKPNFCRARPSETGETTDLRILKQVLEIYSGVAKECIVVESNGYGMSAEKIFESLGAAEICEHYGASFVNLSRDICIPVKREYEALKNVNIPRTILKADVLVNLPVMKVHELTTVSLGLKNMLGIIPGSKAVYHPRISGAICDVIKVRKPDLTIMDGTVGMEAWARPKRMDVIMASDDVVALDVVCCKIMGINPDMVEHIVMAGYYNLGESTLKRIKINGESIGSVRQRFIT